MKVKCIDVSVKRGITLNKVYEVVGEGIDRYYIKSNNTGVSRGFFKYRFKIIEEDFVLPDTWYVIVTDENKEVLQNWRFKKDFRNVFNIGSIVIWDYDRYTGSYDKTHSAILSYERHPNSKEITFEQFKKYVLKQSNMKEIIGYKLIKPEYIKAVNIILDSIGNVLFKDGITKDTATIELMKSTNVLDIWFEKIYEEEFKIEDWVIVNGYSPLYDNKALKITRIYEDAYNLKYYDFQQKPKDKLGFYYTSIVRLATLEEIEKSQVIIIPMKASNGDFEITVGKNAIYYSPDNKILPVGFVEAILNSFVNTAKMSVEDFKAFKITNYPYKIIVDSVTVGCKLNTKQEDWKKVLEAYNSFN